jgi:hypothetical protein
MATRTTSLIPQALGHRPDSRLCLKPAAASELPTPGSPLAHSSESSHPPVAPGLQINGSPDISTRLV